MDTLWKFMEEKGESNGKREILYTVWISGGLSPAWCLPSKIQLIGYMMEYLDTRDRDWIDKSLMIDGHDCSFDSMIGTDMRYNWLESKINELTAPSVNKKEN